MQGPEINKILHDPVAESFLPDLMHELRWNFNIPAETLINQEHSSSPKIQNLILDFRG